MNNQIRTLWHRSGGEFYEGFLGSPNTIKFTEDELKTFVELIVAECACLNFRSTGFVTSEGESMVRDMIKQHFGVE